MSVTVKSEHGMLTSNASDEVARELDQVQYRLGVGPCVDAVNQHRTIGLDIDGEDGRYAQFVQSAQPRFITAVLSMPLTVRELETIGALNYYSATVDHFEDDAVHTASLFARQAAVLLANAVAYAASTNTIDELYDALRTREIIGEAKGIIMVKEECSPEQAFERLRRMSQHTNRKLRDVAEELVRALDPSS